MNLPVQDRTDGIPLATNSGAHVAAATNTSSSPEGCASGDDGSDGPHYRQPIIILDRKLQSKSKHRKYSRRGGDSPKMLKFHIKKFLFSHKGADSKEELHIPFAELQLPFEPHRRSSLVKRQKEEEEHEYGYRSLM